MLYGYTENKRWFMYNVYIRALRSDIKLNICLLSSIGSKHMDTEKVIIVGINIRYEKAMH